MPAFQAAAVICRDGVTTEPFSLFIDRPKTYRGADSERRETNAQRIREESILTLSRPYHSLTPVTPDNIRDILGKPADPGGRAKLAALRSQPVTKDAQLTRLASDFAALIQAKQAQADAERLLRDSPGAQPVKPDPWFHTATWEEAPTSDSGGSAIERFLAERKTRGGDAESRLTAATSAKPPRVSVSGKAPARA
jgi:hypothetical protein